MARTKQEIANRNSVSYDKLFRPIWEDVLPDGVRIYRRILSDPEMKMVTLAAVLESNKARKVVGTSGTAEYMSIIEPIADWSRSDRISILRGYQAVMLWAEIVRDVEPEYKPIPEEPDPTGEIRRDVENERDKEWQTTQKQRQELLEKRLEPYEKEWAEWTDEQLFNECVRVRKENFASQAQTEEFVAQRLYCSCFKDEARIEHFFDSIEQVRNLAPRVKDKLNTSYLNHDIDDIYELKN